jgi:DNA polymerase III subunit delta
MFGIGYPLKGNADYVRMRLVKVGEAFLLYILWGEDQFSMEETLAGIKTKLGEFSLLSTNTNTLEGQKLTLNELRSIGEAMPFLAEKRLLIIKGLLERFEAKEKSNRTKKTGSGTDTKQSESEALAKCINGFPPSTVLVLMDTIEIKKTSLQNNPLFKAITDKAEVTSFPVMKGIKLSQWIESRVSQLNGSMSRQASNILAELIGGDLHTMVNEINKLVSYTGGRMIEEKDVRAVVSAAQEADIFAMVDAIMDRKSGFAEKVLQKLLQNGIAPAQVLVLLARQIQMLIQLKELKSLKISQTEIQNRLGISYGFIWDKISARAGKYTMERLKEIYLFLLQTDLAIKTGRFEGDLALNLLVAELCEK